MHHMIPIRYVYPSGGFYGWRFAPDRGGNRSTKLCLGTYLTPRYMTVHGFLVQDIGNDNVPDALNALTALIREVA